ncbi:MAG: hypothetical protein AB7S38_11385 [Vulcanimicrobiota bacterium]
MRLRLLLGLLLCSASLAAGGVQLRYKPEPQSSWRTSGSLAVKNSVQFPDGTQSNSNEEYDLEWQDDILTRDLTGLVTQRRQVHRWTTRAQQNNIVPSGPIEFQISKLAQQQVSGSDKGSVASSFNQPALFPLTPVAVGQTWPVEDTTHSVLVVGSEPLPIWTRVWGTGTLVAVADGQAQLEFALQSEALGPRDAAGQPQAASWASTEARATIRWTMQVDLATGVATRQQTDTKLEQTVMLGPDKVVSQTESTLQLSTTPGS